MSALLIFAGASLCVLSGLLALPFTRGRSPLHLLPLAVQIAASITGLAGCALGFSGTIHSLTLPWGIPAGAIAVRVDALSAFFAAPVFLLGAAGALYAERYWPAWKPRIRRRSSIGI